MMPKKHIDSWVLCKIYTFHKSFLNKDERLSNSNVQFRLLLGRSRNDVQQWNKIQTIWVLCTVYIFHKMFLNKDKRLANQMYIGIIFEQPEMFFLRDPAHQTEIAN